MIIDLREIKTLWINLDSAIKNAEEITQQCKNYKINNNERFPAYRIDPSDPLCVSNHPGMKPYLAGCGLSHIGCIEKSFNCGPTLVLEDDALITPSYQDILEVPDNCDAIYLGVSTGCRDYISCKYDENFLRLGRMLAAHAIIYISDRYKAAALQQAKHFVYDLHYPWDISPATIQEYFLVLTPNNPYYIQSDNRESEHKWQFFTDKSIEDRKCIFHDNI